MSTLAIIPARGGSKRIPKKNIKPFCGRPMLARTLEKLAGLRFLDKVHVSTEDQETAAVASLAGFPPEFMRSPLLSDDYIGLTPVYQDVLSEFRKRGCEFEAVLAINPCSPLVEEVDLEEAYQQYQSSPSCDILYSICKYPAPAQWAYIQKEDNTIKPMQPEAIFTRSQDLPKTYYETGTFSIFSREFLSSPSEKPVIVGYEVPPDKAVDIDDPEDWQYAERLFSALRNQ